MKNKFLLCACVFALVSFVLSSCKEKTDFDAIANTASEQTLKGFFSGSMPDLEKLSLNVIQYQFTANDTVIRTEMAIGDGLYNAPKVRKFSSWELGEYNDQGKGRYLILNPVDDEEPLIVNFMYGGIKEEDQPLAADHNDKIKDILPSQESLLANRWAGNDTIWFKVDTTIDIMKYDTTFTYKPKKDPETGKTMRDEEGHVIYEQTISKVDSTLVPTKMKWPIAPKTINIRKLELKRDPATLENTGSWYMVSKAYEMNAKRETKVLVDTASAYTFHWAYAAFTSSSSYIIRAHQDNGTEEYFDVKFDAKLPSVTIDKQVLTKVEE